MIYKPAFRFLSNNNIHSNRRGGCVRNIYLTHTFWLNAFYEVPQNRRTVRRSSDQNTPKMCARLWLHSENICKLIICGLQSKDCHQCAKSLWLYKLIIIIISAIGPKTTEPNRRSKKFRRSIYSLLLLAPRRPQALSSLVPATNTQTQLNNWY